MEELLMKQNRQGREIIPEPVKKLREELDNTFDRYFKEPFISATNLLQKDNFTPVCNIEENDNEYLIEADMPGVDLDNIEIEMNGNQLSIRGKRTAEVKTGDDKKQIHVVEKCYGSYY